MSASNELTNCRCGSELEPNQSCQCAHCLKSFCPPCLVKHHHHDVKREFINMKNQIDQILAGFLYRAHNQTEWTNHLTEDRNRLETFIEHIQKYYINLPIITLPSYQWVDHVKSLISKSSVATYESCVTLMFPSLNLCINPK